MKDVSPREAYDLMQSDAEYIYLDVRSIPEFEASHPVGAINIPLMHMTPGVGMSPNPDFSGVVENTLPRNAKLVVGCKTGGRSLRATELLSQMGYTNVTNVRGGFVGMSDNTGRIVEAGWSMLNLPVCTACTDAAHYEALAARGKE